VILEGFFVVAVLRFCEADAAGGRLADWVTGEERKADGDGIVIVSILC
jgi:hypothetical protein